MKIRCSWCGEDPLYTAYHDNEWGVPLHDDRLLFEFLVLEGAQAGLSWLTILKKRAHYRKAFHNFDFHRMAVFTDQDIARLLTDTTIVRNRLKLSSAVKNARAVLNILDQYESLDTYLWRYVDGIPIQNEWKATSEIPAHTKLSSQMSKDLKKQGFSFVGPTICYSFMQATGMVNDHVTDCFRYDQIRQTGS